MTPRLHSSLSVSLLSFLCFEPQGSKAELQAQICPSPESQVASNGPEGCNLNPVLIAKPLTVSGKCHALIRHNHSTAPLLELKTCTEGRRGLGSSERHWGVLTERRSLEGGGYPLKKKCLPRVTINPLIKDTVP